MTDRPCTCDPDDLPPSPCARKYALGECRKAASQPVAWRVECKWLDTSLDQTWCKYGDYARLKSAESAQQRFANPGDIESRIVPLYTHRYIVSLQDEVSGLREANTKLVGALDMVREALHGGEVEDLLLIVNSALSEYHRSMR